MTKTEELLAVLDLPEDEQIKWLMENEITDGLIARSQITGKIVPHWINIELADLAFRLRDEVKGSEGYTYWEEGKQIVSEHITNVGISYNQWFVDIAQPIHWIIASLIAKEEKP